MKGCKEVVQLTGEDFNCCGFCHVDEDAGHIGILEINHGDDQWHICCVAAVVLGTFKSKQHKHEWTTHYVEIDYHDTISGMECKCGAILDQTEVEDLINEYEKNTQ